MPKKSTDKLLCMDNLRHAEYYGMTEIFDDLYDRSKKGEKFTNLMSIILMRENILLAYRNIKTNVGSQTAGTDKLTIRDIESHTADEIVDKVRFILTKSKHGYRPKPVRRKEIPKPYDPTKTRPLGIPCIWDRLIQQCIKQVIEPICEAKFSENSYGFRPNRSAENAIAAVSYRLNIAHLNYVIEFDIKGFFDNVNHSKLIRQIWALGIQDTRLISKIKSILKAPVRMPDNSTVIPSKGTPQGGIISPLLANIVLNELDHWIESQWQSNPIAEKYSTYLNKNGSLIKSNGYRAMKRTKLKEMYIVRYADDFRIFCRSKIAAERTKIAVTQWLSERLKLEISEEKTKIVNAKHRYTDFLGFKIKLRKRGNKWGAVTHISDKQLSHKQQALVEQAKNIAKPRPKRNEYEEVTLYNSMVMGMQNYYCIATCISSDCRKIGHAVMTVLTNRLKQKHKTRLVKTGRKLTQTERERYGKSRQLRYIAGTDEPIYPIGYTHYRSAKPMNIRSNIYTVEGRKSLHTNLRINTKILLAMMRMPLKGRSVEYADNRLSLYSAQRGKCAISGIEFQTTTEIHCHHIIPRQYGGDDHYSNLVLVLDNVHRLIHAELPETIERYKKICGLSKTQLEKVNEMRVKVGLPKI